MRSREQEIGEWRTKDGGGWVKNENSEMGLVTEGKKTEDQHRCPHHRLHSGTKRATDHHLAMRGHPSVSARPVLGSLPLTLADELWVHSRQAVQLVLALASAWQAAACPGL